MKKIMEVCGMIIAGLLGTREEAEEVKMIAKYWAVGQRAQILSKLSKGKGQNEKKK